ncbi:response regulator [Coprobacter sp.]
MKKILIVDDKPEIAKVLIIYLASEYEIVYVENPIKAIAWLQEGNFPDLVLSDLNMPEMRGEDFVSYLQSNEIFRSIPIIILSSEDTSVDRIRLLEAGASDYILKPFNPQELKVRIKLLLK